MREIKGKETNSEQIGKSLVYYRYLSALAEVNMHVERKYNL